MWVKTQVPWPQNSISDNMNVYKVPQTLKTVNYVNRFQVKGHKRGTKHFWMFIILAKAKTTINQARAIKAQVSNQSK